EEKMKYARLSNFKAYIGTNQLAHFKTYLEKNIRNVKRLESLLDNRIKRQRCEEKNAAPNYYFFNIITPDGIDLAEYLIRRGIDTGKKVMRNIPSKYPDHIPSGELFPNTQYIFDNTVQIPVHPGLSERDMNYIARLINKYSRTSRG
ncbi:DegT/DnrJ/EryC1/StrS family aminotransferase, partial [Thermodesulfobacteriota bacterium]